MKQQYFFLYSFKLKCTEGLESKVIGVFETLTDNGETIPMSQIVFIKMTWVSCFRDCVILGCPSPEFAKTIYSVSSSYLSNGVSCSHVFIMLTLFRQLLRQIGAGVL